MAVQQSISRNKLARIFGVSPRYVSMLVEKGLPQIGRGQFDFIACAMWYARFLTGALKQRDAGSDAVASQLRRDRIRLVRAQADRAEFECKEFCAKVVAADEWERFESFTHQVFREQLMAMCDRLAAKLSGKSRSVIRALIDSEARATLVAISAGLDLYELQEAAGGKP